jgi:hypothetical protein
MLSTNLLMQGVHLSVADSHTRHRRHLSKGKQNTFKGTVHRQSYSYHQDTNAKILVGKQTLNTRKTLISSRSSRNENLKNYE